jgi:hypothetical protein
VVRKTRVARLSCGEPFAKFMIEWQKDSRCSPFLRGALCKVHDRVVRKTRVARLSCGGPFAKFMIEW